MLKHNKHYKHCMIMAFTFLLMEDNVMSYMDEYKRWVENVKDEELSEAL